MNTKQREWLQNCASDYKTARVITKQREWIQNSASE